MALTPQGQVLGQPASRNAYILLVYVGIQSVGAHPERLCGRVLRDSREKRFSANRNCVLHQRSSVFS
jgi:hypothetical protein